jgi:hypothetical protein
MARCVNGSGPFRRDVELATLPRRQCGAAWPKGSAIRIQNRQFERYSWLRGFLSRLGCGKDGVQSRLCIEVAMARNFVRFQEGLREAGCDELYGIRPKCRAVVIAENMQSSGPPSR